MLSVQAQPTIKMPPASSHSSITNRSSSIRGIHIEQAMRELSCFGDSSVGVATAAASVSGRAALDRALQAATTSVYMATLPSSGKEMLVQVTWTRSAGGAAGLAVAFDEQDLSPPPSSSSRKKSQQQLVLQKRRGSRSLVTGAGTVVGVHWDTADAKYRADSSSPEPDAGEYYLAVVADGELALLLGSGSAARDLSRRFVGSSGGCGCAVQVSRREQVRGGGGAHVTRCRFRDGGEEHEVAVHVTPPRRGGRECELLWVSIDGEKVAEVRRLGWAFRGNRAAVLPDGEVVDVMWDVHDWWFGAGTATNGAQFMVKARAEKEGRLWMADHTPPATPAGGGFFLLVQCYPR